jgi:hypothetical protein
LRGHANRVRVAGLAQPQGCHAQLGRRGGGGWPRVDAFLVDIFA